MANLVLSLWLRQFMILGEEFDTEKDKKTFVKMEERLERLQRALARGSKSKNGRLSTSELSCLFLETEKLLEGLPVSQEELLVIHASLADADDQVDIDEMVVTLLRISGSSNTIDMMNLDHWQRKLLREVETIHKDSHESWPHLNEAVDGVLHNAQHLQAELQALGRNVNLAREHLLAQIAAEEEEFVKTQQQRDDDELYREVRYMVQKEKERKHVEQLVGKMQGRVDALQPEQHWRNLRISDASAKAALHHAVQQKLKSELEPWLREQVTQLPPPPPERERDGQSAACAASAEADATAAEREEEGGRRDPLPSELTL
mmetsp:Transcript_86679/g.280034  ORF Transcript_86679/g.280034 Transcript_86679/m.280034 type:complete len:318 (-) Transcript_86679:45-998(-)